MTKRPTAKDVAEAAGVSKWTVIRAFKPGASIAEEKKRKILEVAASLSYTPNLLARSLATNLTHQVAVLVDDFANPQKLPFLEVLTDRLQEAGLVAMLININKRFDHVQALLTADQRQVDAIILFGTAFRDETLKDQQQGRNLPPMFVLARDSQIAGVPAIVCDAEQALHEIVAHLYAQGYRKPGFMAGAKVMSTALQREHFYTWFWKERGVSKIKKLLAKSYSAAAGGQAVQDYLLKTPLDERIDVLMCDNDILALGALDVIRGRFGLRVPEDMAVVGFDNFELGGTSAFNLTSYDQPLREMIEMVVAMVTGKREAQTVALPGRLIDRGTS